MRAHKKISCLGIPEMGEKQWAEEEKDNTPAIRVGPSFRNWALGVKSRKKRPKKIFILFYISSSYAKILGETQFKLWDYPRSESRAMSIERRRRRKKEERAKVVITMVRIYTWTKMSAIFHLFVARFTESLYVNATA